MEFTFTPIRVGLLACLLAGFGWVGGFDFPEPGYRHVTRAWLHSITLFGIGATTATVVDHWIGNLDRSNLRWLYVAFGILCMGGALIYQRGLRAQLDITEEQTGRHDVEQTIPVASPATFQEMKPGCGTSSPVVGR